MSAAEDIEQKKKELMGLPPEELASRLAWYEVCLERMSPNIKYFIQNMFQLFRIVHRDRTWEDGILMGVGFEETWFDVWIESKRKDYTTGEIVHEQTIRRIKPGSMLYWELVPLHEVLPPEEKKE